MRRVATLAVLAAALGVSACESTQSKSGKLAAKAGNLKDEKGLDVTRSNPDVRVEGTAVLTDENGSAVAVALKNTSSHPLLNVPIAINLTSAAGKSVFRNDAPGLAASLTHVAAIRPGQSIVWVNDQLTPTAKPAKAAAVIGVTKDDAPATRRLPDVQLTAPKLVSDPIDGLAARGYIKNLSKVEQRQLFIYCVARKGGKIVAAGRGAIERLAPGKRSKYTIFFIGDPRGAALEITAPPTVTA